MQITKAMRKIPWVAIMFLAPAIIAFLMFKYYPLVQAVYMGFFNYSIMDPPGKFVGLDNYIQLLQSTLFWSAAYNTIVFFLLYLLMTFWIPIVQAMFLNEIHRPKLNLFFRFMYLVPSAVPAVAGVLLWKWIYNPDYGLANFWLAKIGLGPFYWLNDPSMVKVAIVIPSMVGGGIGVLLYYSALRGIPKELTEAARIDGAGPWRCMRYINLPHLKFLIVIQFVLFLATMLLIFDGIYVMTGGGPANSTRVIAMLIYDMAFGQYRFGEASAISFMLFIVIVTIAFVQLKIEKSSK